ncbi:MAG TPA: amidohydrolase family protein, partial [Acidobacteriaceae bacterium]|nr:amidohydrolase family protein [Acidobacteriaceae bacterium]
IKAVKAKGVWYIPTLDMDEAAYVYAQAPAWMQSPFFQGGLTPELKAQFADAGWRKKLLGDTKMVAASQASLAINERNLKAMVDAGVKVGFGTDSGANALRIPGFSEHRELHLLVAAGLTPGQAIRMATVDAAALLKLTDRGVIAPGKLADLVVVDGDPTADVDAAERIVAVYHRGKMVGGPIH